MLTTALYNADTKMVSSQRALAGLPAQPDHTRRGQIHFVGRDGSVGIATRFGWTIRGSNPGGGEIYRTRPYWPWGPSSLPSTGYRVSSPGVKRPGRGVDHPCLSTAEATERIELHLYSPSGPSWLVLG